MLQKTYIKNLISISSLLILALAIVNGVKVVSAFLTVPLEIKKYEKDIKLEAFEKVDKVLATKIETTDFTFKGSFDSPFSQLFNNGVTRRTTGRKTKPVVKRLFLKGTLIKDNALAIIEDEDGKTYICKQGDKVHNRLIENISNDEVTIKDVSGKTVLKVKN